MPVSAHLAEIPSYDRKKGRHEWRPKTQIMALTDNKKVARKMNLYWGVLPMIMPTFSTVDEMLSHAKKIALKSHVIKRGDTIIIVSGAHGTKDDITRLIEVQKV